MKDTRLPRWAPDAAAVAALLVFALLPRLLHLGADPPVDFQTGYLADEGAWAHNARQHVLFGRWIMDDHNPGIFAAPLYTLALDVLYRVIGIGLAETRLLSAVSGFLTCLLWYAGLRSLLPVRRALPPALVLGLSYFMLSNNRVAFTESFQLLLITSAAAAVLHSIRRPGWAAPAGVLFVLSLLVKPSAVVMGLVFALFWIIRYRGTGERRAPLLFAGAGLAMAAVVLVLLVLPNWEAVSRQMAVSLGNVYAETAHLDQGRVTLFGWEGLGLTMNWFFIQCGVLILATVLFAVARLGRAVDAPMDAAELLGWTWMAAGLLFLATQRYQPDRRFLLLLPPLALLACSAVQLRGFRLPGRPGLAGRRSWWRVAGIGLLAGGVAGFYGQSLIRGTPVRWVPLLPLAMLAGVMIAFILRRRMPLAGFPLPASLPVLAFLLLDPVRFGLYLWSPGFAVAEASRDIAAMTRLLPERSQIMVGTTADALGLETRLFTFTIRMRDWNQSYMNLDGWERFGPSLAVVTSRTNQPPGDLEQRRVLEGALERGFVPVGQWPVRYDRSGRPTWQATLFAAPGLLGTGSAFRGR